MEKVFDNPEKEYERQKVVGAVDEERAVYMGDADAGGDEMSSLQEVGRLGAGGRIHGGDIENVTIFNIFRIGATQFSAVE
jgi:hypothetical protein